MTCDTDSVITSGEIVNGKNNLASIKTVVESVEDSTTTPDGKTIDTLRGALKKLGWETPALTYTGGINWNIGDERKIVDRAGVTYAPKPSLMPFTTSGTWASGDEALFYPITLNAAATSELTDYVFSTVATMATRTTAGGIVISPILGRKLSTLGYASAGDGLGADYIVTNDTPNSLDIIDLGGGFSASLIGNRFSVDTSNAMILMGFPAGSDVYTKGYTSSDELVAPTYHIKTSAQATTDGDVIDGYGNRTLANSNVAILKNTGQVYVEYFGVRSGLADSGPNHNACADYVRLRGGVLTSLSEVIYTTSESVDFRHIKYVDYKAQINGDADFITVILGGSSLDTSQYYQQKIFKANRGGASPGVRLVGANKGRFEVAETSIFEIWADTDSSTGGTDTYTAYNDIHVLSCTTFQINSNDSTDGSSIQWVNENRIFLRYCLYFKIYDRGYSHNSNQFFGGNFEAGDSQMIFEIGTANTFWGVRGEDDLYIEFGEEAENNNVITDWFGFTNAPEAGDTVVDNGKNNTVKNLNDLTNDRVTIMSFNGSTLQHDSTSSKANLMGVADSTVISAVAATNTVTTAAFQTFYTSPLLEIDSNSQYFDIEVSPKLSGGIKMLINAWDSSMNAIASTGSDVFFSGATNENAGFGEENTTVTNSASQRRIRIENSSAKYIEIVVKGSSAGCSFRRFTVYAASSSVTGQKKLETSSMVPNIIN